MTLLVGLCLEMAAKDPIRRQFLSSKMHRRQPREKLGPHALTGESFCPCGLPYEFQAVRRAEPRFPWHPETPSEVEAKPPRGMQAVMEDEKGPSCVGCDSTAALTPADRFDGFARLLSPNRDGVGLSRGTSAALLGL